jgi:superfamily II DNA or RNA helicase
MASAAIANAEMPAVAVATRRTVQLVVAGTIAMRSDALPARVLERLRIDLSFLNPEYVARKRMGRYLGATPERIGGLVETPDGWVHVPRGAVSLLRARLDDEDLVPVFDDRRATGEPLRCVSRLDLRPYQRDAVSAIRRATQGTVVMPCGGGKTVVGAAAIGEIGRTALVVVHTRDLLEQWRTVLRERLGLDPGVVTEGEAKPGAVTVATVQTLVRLRPVDFDDLARRFGVVVIDEAHHAPAATFQSVLFRLPARWRIGLTATPDREDGLGPLLEHTLGERLFEIGYRELVDDGYLQAPEIEPVFTDFVFEYEGRDDHARCLSALVADETRNALIADLAAREARQAHSVLVLSGRIDHCRRLAELIRERGIRTDVLVGSTAKADRRALLDGFRAGQIQVLIASTVADEGLDIPCLDRIVLAYPGRTKGRTTQRLGRLMRPHPGKTRAVLFDVVDRAVPVLYRQYLERRRLYAQLLR